MRVILGPVESKYTQFVDTMQNVVNTAPHKKHKRFTGGTVKQRDECRQCNHRRQKEKS